jgi:hypothetical protein
VLAHALAHSRRVALSLAGASQLVLAIVTPYWLWNWRNWPFSAGSMPRFPSSVKAEKWVQSTRLLTARRLLSLRDPQLEASIWERSPSEGNPPAASFLDRRPARGKSGRIGEEDSAQPTRNDARHGRTGFGLDSGLTSLADQVTQRVICVTIRLSYNRFKSDLRNHQAIVQPRLYDKWQGTVVPCHYSLMVTQITLL